MAAYVDDDVAAYVDTNDMAAYVDNNDVAAYMAMMMWQRT
jgi:hypothetical protein